MPSSRVEAALGNNRDLSRSEKESHVPKSAHQETHAAQINAVLPSLLSITEFDIFKVALHCG
jgi:hypothetical protein